MINQISTKAERYWAIVPAAGIGARIGADKPKQYLKIHGQPIIVHTLTVLLKVPYIEKIIVVVDQHDVFWSQIAYANHPKIKTVYGGKERADSVSQGLLALQTDAKADDWVLVHDAARPCLQQTDIDKLVAAVNEHPIGGLLGYCTRDTMKRVDEQNRVTHTLERSYIWHALTPQLFRFGLLRQALQQANTKRVTDEASAIEQLGYQPLMVAGNINNIKITQPADLKLAEYYLTLQT